MGFSATYPIVPMLAPTPSTRRPGRAITPGVKFIVAHDTGNPGASAAAHARWYRNDPNPPVSKVASAHLFVDDTAIVETIPALTAPPEQALHVLYDRTMDNQLYGFDANRAAIGVEYCYGPGIDADEAYARYVWVMAYLCEKFSLDPTRAIVGHHILDPGRKTDPAQGLRASGRSYDGLLRDVVQVFNDADGDEDLVGQSRIKASTMRTTTVWLAERSTPDRSKPRVGLIGPQIAVQVKKVVKGELVNGNDEWCQLASGNYVWSGGLL